MIKAITLHQPWATLMAIDAKWIETRGWDTKYRDFLAIHAGATMDKEACYIPEIRTALKAAGFRSPADLPLSAIVCVREVVRTFSTNSIPEDLIERVAQERPFGNYGPDRFGWVTKGIGNLQAPIPWKGAQGLWNWPEPDEVIEMLRAAA